MDKGDIVLEARGLTKEFAGFIAVKDVDLTVRRGTIHALIGPNGAGKTTCFNLLTKFLPPTRGRIVFDGRDITARQAGRRRQAGARALVPDLGRVRAPDRAGERAGGPAAAARRLLRLLALGEGAGALRRAGTRAAGGRRHRRSARERAGGRAALRPQAGAGDRDHARARARADAAGRADGRHGPRGRGPDRAP